MSLDITFYGKNGEVKPSTIELSEDFYKKLIESGFSEIGTSAKIKIKIDDEETEINAIDLEKGKITNRHRFIDFFKEEIIEQSKNMLDSLGDSPSKEEYQTYSYPLRKFQEILSYLENNKYHFLERV
ncbi:hypothetical protein VKI21_12735 [Cyanobacterium aponinum UTEX 3222]|uniref:hypothetical protein n=1 Tax=Cyanobacterium aponinum TaxID=379064 RepID=UPI003085A4C3|nr:hypothetical protein VKI21_12735 [Cyanobacterium aponinum UTEX 3222]